LAWESFVLPKIIALITLITIIALSSPALADSISTNSNNGAAVFEANCAGCHINGGNIVRRGKNLKSKALHKHKVDTQEAIASLVTNGKGIMSAYGDKLTPEQIADVSAYVLQQAEQGWK
jgi:cytochrome c6